MINLVASGRETISEDNFVKFKKLFEDYIFVVLGFKLEGNESNEDGAHTQGLMELLIKLRKAAKLNKDYTTADQIREELNSLGISLKDSPDGTSFEIN